MAKGGRKWRKNIGAHMTCQLHRGMEGSERQGEGIEAKSTEYRHSDFRGQRRPQPDLEPDGAHPLCLEEREAVKCRSQFMKETVP